MARPHGAGAVRRRQPRRIAGRRLPASGADRSVRAGPRLGYTPLFASELEFYLYKESYAEAHERTTAI